MHLLFRWQSHGQANGNDTFQINVSATQHALGARPATAPCRRSAAKDRVGRQTIQTCYQGLRL
eukprot:2257654-Amphidinium_carterae.1